MLDAHVLRKSGHSDCTLNQAERVVNGGRILLLTTSLNETARTTESSVCRINEQIWHFGSEHSGALRLAKSVGMLSEPAKCRMPTWYRLAVVRNEVTRGLDENSPRRNLSMVCTHGLLSVKTQAESFDCMRRGGGGCGCGEPQVLRSLLRPQLYPRVLD